MQFTSVFDNHTSENTYMVYDEDTLNGVIIDPGCDIEKISTMIEERLIFSSQTICMMEGKLRQEKRGAASNSYANQSYIIELIPGIFTSFRGRISKIRSNTFCGKLYQNKSR